MSRRQDRISSLPDEVICHILSFLPTENSVATGILSKRWSSLWRSVPTLDLDDERAQGKESFLRFSVFVYSYLLLRDSTHPIKTCTIKCPNDLFFNFDNVNKWLRLVSQCGGVEYLHLDFKEYDLLYNVFKDYDLLYKLPIGILNCKTLVVLKLRSVIVNDVSSVQLPSLKIMQLENIDFGRHVNLSELLYGCPNLEDFKATFVSALSGPDYDDDDRLGEFKGLTKLISACFYDSLIKLSLQLFCNVQYLYLYFFDLCVYAEVFSDHKHIPTFCNLTHLELHFRCYYSWQLIFEVLQHCPMLKILVLHQEKGDPRKEKEGDWVYPKSAPECISSKLRECTICNCEGMKGELQFARYILRNARVLQIMKIQCFSRSRVQLKVKKKISSYKKSSAMCQLIFKFLRSSAL